MTGLIIAAVIIIALALLRFGAGVEFSDDGLVVTAHAGFVSIKILPRKPKKPKKAKERKEKKEKRRSKKEPETEQTEVKKPGLQFDIRKLIDEAFRLLGKAKRRLLIKELTVLYVQAGGDPFKMATTHGTLQAGLGITQAALESCFRVKRYNLHTSVDFMAEKPRVYLHAHFSIAVWEAIYLGFAALMLFLRSRKTKDKAAAVTETKQTEKAPEQVKG